MVSSQETVCSWLCFYLCFKYFSTKIWWWWSIGSKTCTLLMLTFLLTLQSTSLLEKLTGFQPVKKFPTFCGARRFITTFTSARHLSLSWARSVKSVPSDPASWRSILILSSHLCLGLPSCLFPSGFPTKTLYTPHLSPHTCYMPRPSHSSCFDDPNIIGWGVQISKLFIM